MFFSALFLFWLPFQACNKPPHLILTPVTALDRWAQPYIKEINDQLYEPSIGASAAKALALLGDKKAIAQLETLYSIQPNNYFLLASLASTGTEKWEKKAQQQLSKRSLNDQIMLMVGLEHTKDPNLTLRLRTLYSQSSNALHRLQLGQLLVRMGADDSIEELRKTMALNNRTTSIAAASALYERKVKGAREMLLKELANPYSEKWGTIAITFARHSDPSLLPQLEEAYKNAKRQYDKIWLAYAILRQKKYRIN